MSVLAASPYHFPAKDAAEQFSAPLLYVGWEDHLMFCAPACVAVPPTLKFGEFVAKILPDIFGGHPDFAMINWHQLHWYKSGELWFPDAAKTMTENGLRHKDVIRMKTPGLHGLKGSFS